MQVKIYFNENILWLTDDKSYQHSVTSKAENRQEPSIRDLIQSMETPQNGPMLVYDENIAELLQNIKSQFLVIQAAGGLVTCPEKEVLFMFRRGKWDFPKGKLDDGETLETCALREINEETGLNHLNMERPLTITYHTYLEKGVHILKESHWYLIQTNKDQLLSPQTSEDIEQCIWVKEKDIPDYIKGAHASIADVYEAWLQKQ